MADKQKKRDKQVSRYVHSLFWRAASQNKLYFVLTVTLHAPFFFVNSTFIPLQIALAVQAIVTKRFDQVASHVYAIIGSSLCAAICLGLATWGFNRLGIVAQSYVQKQAFKKYLDKDYDFFSSVYTGSLGAQVIALREAMAIYDLTMFFNVPRHAISITAGLIVIAINSWWLAFVTLACMAIVLSFSIATSKWRLKYRRETSEENSKLAGVTGDALSHATNVKSFANETYELHRLDAAQKPWGSILLKTWDLGIVQNGGRNILVAITAGLLLLASSSMYQTGKIPIAIVTLVQLYVIRLMTTAVEISEMMKVYDAMMSSAYKAAETMMIEPKVCDPADPRRLPPKSHLDIELRDVTFCYPEAKDGHAAVKNLSLKIAHGEKIGIVGFSGSGKTTLSKLLLRFMDVTNGSIMLGGIDVRDVRQGDLRSVISYVPQEPLLFHRSIRENIAYARPDSNDSDVRRAAKMAYVDEFVHDLPQGYETLVGERGVKLSGGQRQRVAIARALLKDAPILVLDEATSALDSESERLIQKALWELMKGRMAIVIAHRLSTIQRMDRIIVMDKGKIVQQGSHKELLNDARGIYAKLWSHQSDGYIGTEGE